MSDNRRSLSALGFHPGTVSRVQRSGNSKVIPIPAEVARQQHIEIGDEYVLGVVSGRLVYDRAAASVRLTQIEGEVVGVVSDSAVVGLESTRSTVPPLDWEF